jgi:hypothetical protein
MQHCGRSPTQPDPPFSVISPGGSGCRVGHWRGFAGKSLRCRHRITALTLEEKLTPGRPMNSKLFTLFEPAFAISCCSLANGQHAVAPLQRIVYFQAKTLTSIDTGTASVGDVSDKLCPSASAQDIRLKRKYGPS